MEQMVYEAPDGSVLFEPTTEQLASVILHAGHQYWQQGGDGEAAIRVAKQRGDGRSVSHSVIQPDRMRVEYAAGQPELWIKQPEPGQFLFTWDCNGGWFVPYDGSGFVMDERGADSFKIPRACLVNATIAVEVVCEFLRSRRRSNVVRWLPWHELPLPADWLEA